MFAIETNRLLIIFNKRLTHTGNLEIFNPASWSAINVDASNELQKQKNMFFSWENLFKLTMKKDFA